LVRGIHIPARRYAALDPEVRAALERLHKDDEEARQARDAAEAQFDEADRRMSTSMACTGAQMAIDAWEMREKVIRKAETLARGASEAPQGRSPFQPGQSTVSASSSMRIAAWFSGGWSRRYMTSVTR
jgi:hypothetical protein